MKIAVPTTNKSLCMHFGHCELFVFFEVDEQTKTIKDKKELVPPPHEPGVLPKWIGENGANVVLAGGMGQRAQDLFQQNGVKVITGVTELSPEKAVMDYLNNSLVTGKNVCDH